MKALIISALAATLLISCHTHSHDKEHSHSHESSGPTLEPLAYTLYTAKTELFVEFKPLIVGEESRFAAHFTSLGESFKAIGEGSVTLSLTGPAGNQSITADAPEVPGIFRLRMTPEQPGMHKLVFDIKTTAYTDQITIDSVTVYPDVQSAMNEMSEEGSGGNAITYLKEQAWKIDFANIPVKRTTFYSVVKTSGLVTSAPGDEQTIAARTSGIVSFTGNNYVSGMPVRAGQSLFTISSKGFTDNNASLRLQEAKIALDKAKADYDRLQKLLADQLATQKELLQAKTEYDSALAFYNSLSGNYGAGGQSIGAIQGGFLKSLLVTPGQFVEAGQPLAIVSRNNRLAIKAELSQTDFSRMGTISSANFKINNQLVYSLEELNGRVLSVGKFAENSLFIPVYFDIANKEGLLPGSYIEVFIKANLLQNALVIPVTALMEEQGNYYCYVQTEGESFEKRELTLGGNDGKNVQVLSGLQEGDRVVTKGAYNIKLSTASGTMPSHGHEH